MAIDPARTPTLPEKFQENKIFRARLEQNTGNSPGPNSNLRDTLDRIESMTPLGQDQQPTQQNTKDLLESVFHDSRKGVRESYAEGYAKGLSEAPKTINKAVTIHLLAKGAGLGIGLASPVVYWIAQHRAKKAQSQSATA